MTRGLDHIVHAVRDLDAAAAFYRRAGFQVGARNRHPWGTHNHIVQFPGFFIEIVTLAEPEKLGTDGLSVQFGAFNRDAIARGDGFSMLIAESVDIVADAAAFAARGIGCSPVLPFSREVRLGDGSIATVGFSLAFARAPDAPEAGFAACQQHNPAAFWNKAFQAHENGAQHVAGAVLIGEDPSRYRAFLSAFSDAADVRTSDNGVAVETRRGAIDIVSATGFSDVVGEHVARPTRGLRLAALRLVARDLAQLEQLLHERGIAARRHQQRLVVSPAQAFGATLVFEG